MSPGLVEKLAAMGAWSSVPVPDLSPRPRPRDRGNTVKIEGVSGTFKKRKRKKGGR